MICLRCGRFGHDTVRVFSFLRGRFGNTLAGDGGPRWVLTTTAVPFDVGELGTAMELSVPDYHMVGLYSLTEQEVGFALLSLPNPSAYGGVVVGGAGWCWVVLRGGGGGGDYGKVLMMTSMIFRTLPNPDHTSDSA